MSNAHENAGSYKKADFCIMYLYATAFFLFCRMDRRERTAVDYRACRRQSGTDIEREDLRSKRTKRSFDLAFLPKKKTENKKFPVFFFLYTPHHNPTVYYTVRMSICTE